MSPIGVCINPPPPTMASTKPAAKAAIQSKIMVVVAKMMCLSYFKKTGSDAFYNGRTKTLVFHFI